MGNIHENLSSLFTNIANAIRAKTGKTDTIKADDFPSAIAEIEVSDGIDLSVVTAGADDVVQGKTIIDANGVTQQGTIPEKTSSDVTVSGATVSIPAGRYKTAASKSISSGRLSKPSISVNSSGVITATSRVSTAGYLSTSSTTSETYNLTTQAGTTITPGTSTKTAVASGRYTTGTVYVSGDSNLKAENIKSGVSIFGVAGGYQGSSGGLNSVCYTASPTDSKTIRLGGLDTHDVVGFVMSITGTASSYVIVNVLYYDTSILGQSSVLVQFPQVLYHDDGSVYRATNACTVSIGSDYIQVTNTDSSFDTDTDYIFYLIKG